MSFTQNRGYRTRYCNGCFHKCEYGYTTINGKIYPTLAGTVINSYKALGNYIVFVQANTAIDALKQAVEISQLCDNYKRNVSRR